MGGDGAGSKGPLRYSPPGKKIKWGKKKCHLPSAWILASLEEDKTLIAEADIYGFKPATHTTKRMFIASSSN